MVTLQKRMDLALIWASEKGYTEQVLSLLQAGADVHANNDSALRISSEDGNTEIVQLLLQAGANVNANNDSALISASANGHTEVVRLLLQAGADVHARDGEPLTRASRTTNIDIVQLLLEAGADIKTRNTYDGFNHGVVKLLAQTDLLKYNDEYKEAEVLYVELVDYVFLLIEQGIDNDTIITIITQAGYTKKDVEYILSNIYPESDCFSLNQSPCNDNPYCFWSRDKNRCTKYRTSKSP